MTTTSSFENPAPNDSRCHTCGSAEPYSIYQLDKIPPFQNKLYETAQVARSIPTAAVDLTGCPGCGFVHNRLFDNKAMDYDGDYQNSQDSSAVFRAHLDSVASLIFTAIPIGSRVVEIGCGKGFFLELLRSKGVDVVGFDPTYEGDQPYITCEYFNAHTSASTNADALVMRHTLEHIEQPFDFLTSLKSIVPPETIIFIEVPRYEWIEDAHAFWDIFHEHCNYFTEEYFGFIFGGRASIELVFHDQYMLVRAPIGDLVKSQPRTVAIPHKNVFSGDIARFESVISNGGRHFVWGAGAKGIAFVNILDPTGELVECVIDINPRKQGTFVGLTGHPCVRPADVVGRHCEVRTTLWIMNANYREEIEASLPPLNCQVIALGN